MACTPKPARRQNRRFGNAWRIEATFTPIHTHDLKPDAPRIGERLVLTRGWVMDPGYNRYAHQLVWLPVRDRHAGWLPSCDLSNARIIR